MVYRERERERERKSCKLFHQCYRSYTSKGRILREDKINREIKTHCSEADDKKWRELVGAFAQLQIAELSPGAAQGQIT